MQYFTDTQQRRWELNLTIGALKRIKAELDISVEDDSFITKLYTDPIFMVAVIWNIISRQAEQQAVTEEDFAEAVGGDVLGKAQEALVNELQLFFTARGLAANAKAVGKMQAILSEAQKQAEAKIDSIDVQSVIAKELSGLQSTD